MSLFGKKQPESKPALPKLPELPKLPGYNEQQPTNFQVEEPEIKEFPTMPEEMTQEFEPQPQEIHQLPSFPTSEVGEQFSQNSIKNAVVGDDFDEETPEMGYKEIEMPQETMQSTPEPMIEAPKIEAQPMIDSEPEKPKSNEPIFIRIDKFEESMKIFDGVKGKLGEIEHMLNEVKELKEKEQEELTGWEDSIQKLKLQIEKVDRDIFSKIE